MNKENLQLRRLGENDRFITVDAYADALPFYYKQGFIPLSKTDEGADTRLLYFDLQSVNVNE